MKRSLKYALIASLVGATVHAQSLDQHAKERDWEEINFEFNQAVLTDGFPSLLRLSSLLQEHPDYKLTLTGNTDQVGSARANEALSVKRAEAVARFLEKYGARPNQIQTVGNGKKNLALPGSGPNDRFVNRRVTVQVTAPDGRVIGDGSMNSAITAFETYSRTQLGKIDDMMSQLRNLEQQLQTLRTDMTANNGALRADTGAIRQDTGAIRQDTTAIRQDTRTLVGRPSPLTEEETTRIAKSAADYALTQAALRNRKYTLLGVGVGPTFGGGRNGIYSTNLSGRVFIPFGNGKVPEDHGTHAVLAEGDWTYYHRRTERPDGRNEGTFNLGLVNRYGHMQVGTIAQFNAINVSAYRGGGWLGAGILTVDYVGQGFIMGIFGAKGFHPESNLTTTSLSAINVPAYLRYDDQLGFQSTAMVTEKLELHSSVAWKKRVLTGTTVAGDIKMTWWARPNLGLFAMVDENPGLQSTRPGYRMMFGVNIGNWLRPGSYGSTTGAVPVTVPTAHYELLKR